jgi:hypothetical protein
VRSRSIATVALVLALMSAGVAQASTGPRRLQALAAAQTVVLFAHLTGQQVASPAACDEGQGRHGLLGEFLLPTLSFGSGDASFDCRISARVVLVDLGGAIATEAARGDTWTTADGQELLFTRANLERICDDALRRFPSPAPATVDGSPFGGTRVSTPAFPVLVRRTAPAPYWRDSVDVGHPGLLFASYCGWKAEVPLRRGDHTITVDLTDAAGAPTHFRYDITVR